MGQSGGAHTVIGGRPRLTAIAAALDAKGYPVTGDISPGEAETLDAVFTIFVKAMALNNPVISDLVEDVRGERARNGNATKTSGMRKSRCTERCSRGSRVP